MYRLTKTSLSVLTQVFFFSSNAASNRAENFVKKLFTFSEYSISKSFSIRIYPKWYFKIGHSFKIQDTVWKVEVVNWVRLKLLVSIQCLKTSSNGAEWCASQILEFRATSDIWSSPEVLNSSSHRFGSGFHFWKYSCFP